MKLKRVLTVAVLAGASAFYACSSSSAKKTDAPPPTAETPESGQPAAPEEQQPTGPATTPASAAELQKKSLVRYSDSVDSLVKLPGNAKDEDAQKVLEAHFFAIECGVHFFGEDWTVKQNEILRTVLDTQAKQEAYVRAQGKLQTSVLELHPATALDNLCK